MGRGQNETMVYIIYTAQPAKTAFFEMGAGGGGGGVESGIKLGVA